MKILMFLGFMVPLAGHKTIILDPGHGGVYTGAVTVRGLCEKDVALAITKRIAARLTRRGYRVILTRTTDAALDKHSLMSDLEKRAHMARTHKADIYVSVHLNASANSSLGGCQVYVPHESRYPIRSYALASALHYELTHKIPPCFKGGTLGNLNTRDHGILASRFNVLTKAVCPAVLLELDYLSNPQSERKLRTEAYQNQLACAVSCGIRRYFERGKEL